MKKLWIKRVKNIPYFLSILLLGQHDFSERSFSQNLKESEVFKRAFGSSTSLAINQFLQRRFGYIRVSAKTIITLETTNDI